MVGDSRVGAAALPPPSCRTINWQLDQTNPCQIHAETVCSPLSKLLDCEVTSSSRILLRKTSLHAHTVYNFPRGAAQIEHCSSGWNRHRAGAELVQIDVL